MSRKPSCLLVVMSGFGPGDVIASFFRFAKQGDRDLCDRRAFVLKFSNGFMKRDVDFFRDHIDEKLLGQTEPEFAERPRGEFLQRGKPRLFFAAQENRMQQKSRIRGGPS